MSKSGSKQKALPLHLYKNLIDMMSKANDTYHNIVKENKKLGIPTPFSLEGKIYYLMPDGKIVLKKA
jgi:hypothetical protein